MSTSWPRGPQLGKSVSDGPDPVLGPIACVGARSIGKVLVTGQSPPSQPTEGVVTPFGRDQSTWLLYSAIGLYAFHLYAFGPALAILRPELHLSYAAVGIHSAAWAIGTIAASIGYSRAVRLLGRRRLFWWSALGFGTGSIVFSLAYVVTLSLLAAVRKGGAGTAFLRQRRPSSPTVTVAVVSRLSSRPTSARGHAACSLLGFSLVWATRRPPGE
jgi:MFS family permease